MRWIDGTWVAAARPARPRVRCRAELNRCLALGDGRQLLGAGRSALLAVEHLDSAAWTAEACAGAKCATMGHGGSASAGSDIGHQRERYRATRGEWRKELTSVISAKRALTLHTFYARGFLRWFAQPSSHEDVVTSTGLIMYLP